MIQELLQKLGLSEKEIEVYLAIFGQGKTTPARLAKATKINRSTVYAVLNTLKEKGLVIEDITSKVLYFSPASAEQVEEMFYYQQEELKEKKKIAAKLAEELEKMPQSKEYSIPKIRFVEEGDMEDFLFSQMERWYGSMQRADKTFWGFQDPSFVQHNLKWLSWVWKKYPDMFVKLLSNQSEVEEKIEKDFPEERSIKFWGKELDFSATTWCIGDYLVMITTRQKPFYLVEIHDAVLAHNMREVFKKIWKDVKQV
ncbi:MAG TPA: helix-turn-helix domain-containing protein [Patescibacteria group bacterium]